MTITFDDFKKIEIRAGQIQAAEPVEGSEKLLKLKVFFGGEDTRQVISGIAKYFSPETIVGKTAMFVTNLESRAIMGFESQAMICATGEGETFSLIIPEKDVAPGSELR